MNARSTNNNNCASCQAPNGQCTNSYPSSNDMQGEVNVCPSSSSWNYGQSAVFQIRNMPAPSHGFLQTENPISFSLTNPERYRALTYMPAAPQKLATGSITLNSDGLHTFNQTNLPTMSRLSNTSFGMYKALPPGNTNSSYCASGYQDCSYKQGLTRAGPAHDGCVPSSISCSQALSGV